MKELDLETTRICICDPYGGAFSTSSKIPQFCHHLYGGNMPESNKLVGLDTCLLEQKPLHRLAW